MGDGIRFILCDIEGTTTSISFVHDTLFPYARDRLRAWVAAHGGEERVRGVLREVAETLARDAAADPRRPADLPPRQVQASLDLEAPPELPPRQLGEDPAAVGALLRWIAEDRKHPALKRLQGWIWAEGYAAGALASHLYDDVAPALARWHAAGKALGIYSSGSVEAQRQLFSRTPAGDLTPLLSHHFDTAVGPKRERASYEEIARRTGIAPAATLFLSDVVEELDAARAAGMRTTQLVRPGTSAGEGHPAARTFAEVRIELHAAPAAPAAPAASAATPSRPPTPEGGHP